MKKVLIFLIIITSGIILSGCSLLPSGNNGSTVKTFTLSQSIWKSTDGGKTWEAKTAGEGAANTKDPNILSFAIDPGNSNNIYAGLQAGGILKSNNGGDTWTFMNFQSEKVYGLALDPSNSRILYASGVWQDRGKIFKTEDAGDNWKEIYTSPSSGPLIISLALDKNRPGTIYATTSENEAIKSSDGGNSWENVHLAESPILNVAVDSGGGYIYLLTVNGFVFRSADGSSFEDITKKTSSNNFGFSSHQFDVLATDPFRANNVYLAGGGGIIFSQDGGDTWTNILALNNPQKFPVRALAINSGQVIYGVAQAAYKSASQTNGTFKWVTSQFETKKSVNALMFDPANPDIIYLGLRK